jgi:two-component system nitrogen regulation sensor histidine kinase NtrY
MRMRFAISGAPAKSEGAESAAEATSVPGIGETVTDSIKDPETKQPAAETNEPAEKTNESTKIEASTGS